METMSKAHKPAYDVDIGVEDLTEIQKFYSNANILITGGTGFLGKILVEKLLRSCPTISNLYLLVRSKRGKSAQARAEEILEDVVFNRMKTEQPKSVNKIIVISGDCSLPGLGLSPQDRLTLKENVNIVFHAAATVRFDEKLRLATAINIKGTRDILILCREMEGLKAIVHVSTAYANCPWKHIEEKFYEPPISWEKLISIVDNASDDKQLEGMIPGVLRGWPNTYSFTKAIAEDLVRTESEGLPTAIFRPSIVVSTYREPVQGWVDNLYGATGVCAGAGVGILRTLHCDEAALANITPVDTCVNSLICTAWETSRSPEGPIRIYNYVSTEDNSMTWGTFMNTCAESGVQYPSVRAVWYYSLTLNKHWLVHWLYVVLFHLFPALLVDTALLCVGKQPRMLHVYGNIIKFNRAISYFCMNTWTFRYDNVMSLWKRLGPRDRDVFFFDMQTLDWAEFFREHMLGVRLYLLKDQLDTLPHALAKWRWFYWAHHLGKWALRFFLLRMLWYLVSLLLR